MPRQARIDIPGAIHHLICRGSDRQNIFHDDHDRDDFVRRLGVILVETATRCFAWALLPNHFHLLLQTGATPIATVMSRLLTGYAGTFNRRHLRHGHLFQNRYKSILCQEDSYLLELVRYIHLNPLRAGIVPTIGELARYPYGGHSQILGYNSQPLLDVEQVLQHFGKTLMVARKAYGTFLEEGVGLGRRPELAGGGLVRSSGGWKQVKSAKEAGDFLKSDERILGDSNFVNTVLSLVAEKERRQDRYLRQGFDIAKLTETVAEVLAMDVVEVRMSGRQPQRVKARNLLCYWGTRELGITATALAAILNLSQPAVSLSAQRGEKLVQENGWRLEDFIAGNL